MESDFWPTSSFLFGKYEDIILKLVDRQFLLCFPNKHFITYVIFDS